MKELVLETYYTPPKVWLANQVLVSSHWEYNPPFIPDTIKALSEITADTLKPPLKSTLTATLETSRNTAHLLKTPGKTALLLLAAIGLVALSYVPGIQKLPFFDPTKDRQDWAIGHPIRALHCPDEIIDDLSAKYNIPRVHLVAVFNNLEMVDVEQDAANWVKFDAEDTDRILNECEVELIPPKVK